MGCFLGCFGGDKNHRRRKHRVHRASPQSQRCRVQNVQRERVVSVEQIITETLPIDAVSGLSNNPEGEEQLNPSPTKRVTFDSNITTYDHVSLHESIESLPECNTNAEKKPEEDLKISSQSHSLSDDNSVISSIGSYPPNHRYHNSRESDDESEEYNDSDLDDVDEDYDDDDDHFDEEEEEDTGIKVVDQDVLSKMVNIIAQETNEKIESPMVNARLSDVKINAFGSKTNVRDRSNYFNSVLNPVENINQWKVVKSKGTNPLKSQKENLTTNFEPPRLSFTFEPSNFKSKSDQLKNKNQEIAVDASLSNWLVTPEKTCGLETITPEKTVSEGSMKSFEDRPILGAWTVNELRQISAASSPRKSPSRSPDEIPIIGTVGSYWNNNSDSSVKYSESSVSSYKGIPNTTSKYREDKRVNWHSTPFETRLDRALNRGAAEA